MTEVQHIAIARADGSVAIMQFITRSSRGEEEFEREATDEAIEAEIAKAELDAVSWRRIDPDEIPSDRTFRNAWASDGKALSVDMAKARAIHRDRLRAARAGLFPALDAAVNKLAAKALTGSALTAAEKTQVATLEAKRQALRDATTDPAIDAATTPDELKAVLPAALRA